MVTLAAVPAYRLARLRAGEPALGAVHHHLAVDTTRARALGRLGHDGGSYPFLMTVRIHTTSYREAVDAAV